MFAIRRSAANALHRPVTLRICQCGVAQRPTAAQWAAPPSGRRCGDDRPPARRSLGVGSTRRWQATLSHDESGTSVACLRSQMYAITSPRRKRARAVGASAEISQITRAFPAVAATSDSVRDLADLCRLLARAQPTRRKNVRLQGERWYDAALDRCMVLLLPPIPRPGAGDLSTLAHALALLPLKFNTRDVELVDLLGQHVAASVTEALAQQVEATDRTACGSWNEQSLAMTMRALARLAVRHEPAVLALSRLAHHLQPSLGPQATATVLWSLAVLNCVEEPYVDTVDSLSQRFRTAAAQQVQRAGSSDHGASLSSERRSAAANRSKHSGLKSGPRDESKQRYTTRVATAGFEWASLRTAVVTAWSLTVLDRLSVPVLRSVFAVIAAAEKRGELQKDTVNDVVLCQLHQVMLAMELGHVSGSAAASPCSNRGRSGSWLSTLAGADSGDDGTDDFKTTTTFSRPVAPPGKLAERCRTTFRRINKKVGHSSQYSPTATAVAEALAIARPECTVEREQLLHDCSYSVDLLLRQERIAVEVDGKVHYCRRGPWEEHDVTSGEAEAEAGGNVGNAATPLPVGTLPRKKLGRTALKHRQIQAKGWRMVAVPWWEWEASQKHGGGAPVHYLARKIWGVSGSSATG